MTWEELINLYMKACGQTEDCATERFAHLNFAYRHLCGVLELPELHLSNATVTTVDGQDWVEMDCDVFSIDWIVNKSTGRKLDPEPAGSRGRAEFFEVGEDKPSEGPINFWVRRGNRLYLRNTPDDEIDLTVSFRFHPPTITVADLAEHPITPAQYDWALVRMAASNYFSIHIPMSNEGLPDYGRSERFMQQAIEQINQLKHPVAEEQKDRRDYIRQAGYDFGVR